MGLDKKLIQLRIDIIERNLKEIEKIVKSKKLSYRDELALKHALLECIEACVDISNHIISTFGFRRPVDYKDVFAVLEENKLISKKFAERLMNMAKFRHVLVHPYAFVNRNKILEISRRDIKDVKKFVEIVLKLIKK